MGRAVASPPSPNGCAAALKRGVRIDFETPKGNGGRHCCQPPLRRAKDMPVFVTWSKTRRPRPALDPGSPAQASLSIRQLPRERSQTDLPDCAARRFAGHSIHPACSKSIRNPQLAKTTRCSTALLGTISTASRFAHRNSEELREPRRTTGRLSLPAPHTRLAPNQNPKALPIACRRRSDLWSPAAPVLPLPAFWRGRDRRPDHPMHHARVARVAKAKNAVGSLWITGISGTTVGTFLKGAESAARLPFRSPPPTCPSA